MHDDVAERQQATGLAARPRSTLGGRFAALLLVSTCLAGVAAPAWAAGGGGAGEIGGNLAEKKKIVCAHWGAA